MAYGLLDRPPTVGIDPDPSARTDGIAYGAHPRDVLVERLSRLGDLDLGGRAAVSAGDDRVCPLGTHGRHRAVDRHAVTQRVRQADIGRLHGRGQPTRGLVDAVVPERAELTDAGRAVQQDALAPVHAPEGFASVARRPSCQFSEAEPVDLAGLQHRQPPGAAPRAAPTRADAPRHEVPAVRLPFDSRVATTNATTRFPTRRQERRSGRRPAPTDGRDPREHQAEGDVRPSGDDDVVEPTQDLEPTARAERADVAGAASRRAASPR